MLAFEPSETTYRRLGPADAAEFQALRTEGLTLNPLQFRIDPADEAHLTTEAIGARLADAFVVGAYRHGTLVGVGGLSRDERRRLRHKALLWGMYVREGARGDGVADGIIERLLAEAHAMGASVVLLTVIADNPRARRVYERWGFRTYGIEPRAVRIDGRDVDEILMARLLD